MDDNLDVISTQPHQQRIYNGLKNIGTQLAAFYLDGVRIFNSSDFLSKTNLIGHVVREIGYGLTDVLDETKNEGRKDPIPMIKKDIARCLRMIKQPKDETVDSVENVIAEMESILQSIAINEEKQQGGNKKSIIKALDTSEEDDLAQEWLSVLDKVHATAHRGNVWEDPKDPKIGEDLWVNFEKLMEKLIGTYSKISDRIDRVVKYDTPTDKLVTRISGILKTASHRDYFFKKLNSPQWIAPLMKANYFDLRKDFNPNVIHRGLWSELEYISRMANDKENMNEETVRLMSQIVSNVVSHNSGDNRIDNPYIDDLVAQIISKLPKGFITIDMINYLGFALEDRWGISNLSATIANLVLPQLIVLQGKDMVYSLLEKGIRYQKEGGSGETRLNHFWLNDFLVKHDNELAKLCGSEIIDLCLTKMRHLIAENNACYYFDGFTKNKLEKLHDDNYEDVLTILLTRMIHYIDVCKSTELASRLSVEDHPFFRRLRIYILNKHVENIQYFFENIVINMIDEDCEDELIELLESKCELFTEDQQSKILEWIERSVFGVSELYIEKAQLIQKYRKLKFLNALPNTKNEKILEIALKYSEETKELTDNQKSDNLPSKTEILNKTNAEIVGFFKERYEDKNITPQTEKALKMLFENVIEEKSNSIFLDIQPFYKLQWSYQYVLIRYFTQERLIEGDTSWMEIFNLFHSILIDDEKFWDNMGTENYDSRRMAIGSVLSILEKFIDMEVLSSDDDLLGIYEKILELLAARIESTAKHGDNHKDMRLGNNLARVYFILIKYLLKLRKTSGSKLHKDWVRTLLMKQAEFAKSPELFAAVGAQLKMLAKLEKNLTGEICTYFPEQEKLSFEVAAINYLNYYMYPDKNVYVKIKGLGFYDRMIDGDMPIEVDKSLVLHLVYAFFRGWEKDDKLSLLERLICKKNPKQLMEVLNNLSVEPNAVLSLEAQNKVKIIWKKVFEQVRDDEDNNGDLRSVIPNLIKPITGITSLDTDVWNILETAVKYPSGKYQYYINFCEKHVESQPKRVGALFLQMLGSDFLPSYEEEAIKNVVERLFSKEETETAIAICNIYSENGFYFLRDIENKYV